MAMQLPIIANNAPAQLKWSTKAAEAAQAKHAFLRVGGPKVVTRRYLSGAERSWKKADPSENTTIFSLGTRLTGTPENVRRAMQWAGFSDSDIAQAIANAITRDNYTTTQAAAYNQEKAAHEASKCIKPSAECYSFTELIDFANKIKEATISTKTGESKGSVAAGGKGGSRNLADKVAALPRDANGRYLEAYNVSKFTEAGTGATKVKTWPKIPGKNGNMFANSLRVPFVSNNLASYELAIQRVFWR